MARLSRADAAEAVRRMREEMARLSALDGKTWPNVLPTATTLMDIVEESVQMYGTGDWALTAVVGVAGDADRTIHALRNRIEELEDLLAEGGRGRL